jgi:hypothetical protein
VNEAFPANVNARSVPGAIDEPVPRRAICAAPTMTGLDPNALDNFTRTRRPAMLVRRIIRTV